MNLPVLLVGFGLMGTVCHTFCPKDCTPAIKKDHQHFKHVSDLRHSSVAPWNMRNNSKEGRDPVRIHFAECKNCTIKDMIAKTIFFQVAVYQRVHNGTGESWCMCPYDLAVGCTCVKKQRHQDNSQ